MLEEVFASKGRLKVLLVLLRLGEANITKIVKETGLNHKLVEEHLSRLVELGLVHEKRYGRLRVFSINTSNPKTIILRELLYSLRD